MASELAKAYVQIIPSAQGLGGKLEEMLGGEADKAGVSAGSILGNGMAKGLKLAGAAITAATAAVGKFAMDSIEAGKAFDSSMSQVAATMGITMEQMENQVGSVDLAWGTFNGNLREYAQEMGAHTAFSASQAADALNYMALAGYDAQTSMEMLPNVLNLAAAGGMELGAASDMVTDASSALGLSIEETALMVDKMAKASSITNTSVSQLGEAILTVGGNAKSLKGGTTELAQVLGLMADNGIKGAEAGTHLRNIMLSLTPKSDAAAEAMERLGFNAYDANGELRPLNETFGDLSKALDGMSTEERTNMLSAMFNKTDLAAVNALLATNAGRWNDVALKIDAAWFTWDSFEQAGLNYDAITDKLFELGIDADAFTDALGRSSGNAQTLVDDLWELADAGVSYDDVVNALGGDVDSLQESFDSMTGAAQAMADTQLDNLEGDLTLFQSALEGCQIAISDSLTPTLRQFVQFGSDGLSELTTAFNEGGLDGAMEAFGNILSKGINMLVEGLPRMVEAGGKLLAAVGQGLIDNLPIIIDSALKIINMLLDGFVSALPKILDAGITIILELVKGIAEALPDLVPAAVDAIIEFCLALIDNIDLVIDAAAKIIIGLAEGLLKALPRLIDKAPTIISKLVQALIKLVPEMLKVSVELISKLATGLLANVGKLLTAGGDIIRNLFNTVKNAISNFDQIGSNIVDGIRNGISNAWNNLVSWFSGLFGDLTKIAKDILGIASPSKVFRKIGENTVEGFDIGMQDFGVGAMEDVQSAMDELSGMSATVDAIGSSATLSTNVNLATPSRSDDINAIEALLQRYLPMLENGTNVNVSLQGDAQGLFRTVRKEVNQFTKSTGNSPFIAPA